MSHLGGHFCHQVINPCAATQKTIVSAWVLTPLANHNPVIFLVPLALKNLTNPPTQTKSPDNSNIFYIFSNNTDTSFRTAYKHILIPSYVIQVI